MLGTLDFTSFLSLSLEHSHDQVLAVNYHNYDIIWTWPHGERERVKDESDKLLASQVKKGLHTKQERKTQYIMILLIAVYKHTS